MNVEVSVPGKIMLSGEYAVLNGGKALATTIDRSLRVVGEKRAPGTGCIIDSDLWANSIHKSKQDFDQYIDKEKAEEPLIDSVLKFGSIYNLTDLKISVKSSIEIQWGIGSSSALRLGVGAAIRQLSLSNPATNDWEVPKEAWKQQLEWQGKASGYDIAAQFLGGVVAFEHDSRRTWPGTTNKLQARRPLESYLEVFIGGAGAPTTSTTQTTREWLQTNQRNEKLIVLSQSLNNGFEKVLASENNLLLEDVLIPAVSKHRKFFSSSPLFPSHLSQKLDEISGIDQLWSWKTTGAGGEDAILVVGSKENRKIAYAALQQLGWKPLPASFSSQGLKISNTNRSTS